MNAILPMTRPVRICIVEDDPVLRAYLSGVVMRVEGFVLAGAAATLAKGRDLLRAEFDVLLVDLALPDGSGLELIQAARTSCSPNLKIIVISVFGDVGNVVRAIEVGADGYLLKGADVEQAEMAIRNVVAGGAPISPSVASHILARLRTVPPMEDVHHAHQSVLTERERDVLTDLSKGHTYKEVAKRQGISHHTVADHVKAIYRKLSVRSRGAAVFEAMQSGIIEMKN
jgi:DNA-binding NarL/FixJ family response regulator